MDKLNKLKDNIKLTNTYLSECEKICNKIKRLLKFKDIKKDDVDIYIDNSDNCIVISYCLSEMNIEDALAIMETNGYITEKISDFNHCKIIYKKKVRLIMNEEKYLEWMKEYFNSITSDKNIDIKKVLSDVNNEGKLSLVWDSLYTVD